MGFPEGSGVEFRVLSYSSQSEYRMNKQQQLQSKLEVVSSYQRAHFDLGFAGMDLVQVHSC